MKNTRSSIYQGPRLPKSVQRRRMMRVIRQELTPCQRETLLAYYMQNRSITDIAKERGVNKSTVCRTLHRAEERVRRCLRY